MLLTGGSAGLVAEVATLPVDTAKVRMQVFQQKYQSLLQSVKLIAKEEGFGAFYQGCFPGLLRQMTFASFRMGLFDYAMERLTQQKGADKINIMDRIFYGVITGAVAISIAQPFDMLKVRFQSDIKSKGAAKRYTGVVQAMKHIYQNEGFMAFYQSLPPNIFRNSIINAAELATYTQFKSFFLKNGIFKDENFGLYFACSFLAGWVAVTVGSPFDVIKSRMMDGKMVDGKKVLYSSIGDAVQSLAQDKGVKGFYAGYIANCSRIISWNVVMFLTKEQITKMMSSNRK